MASDPNSRSMTAHRLTPTNSESNHSPRASLLDPIDFSRHPTRPSLPFRHPSSTASSTSADLPRRASRASTLHRVASGIRRIAFPADAPDEWSVFGEAMSTTSSPPSAPARTLPTPSIPIPGTGETGDSSHWTNSPLQELHHEGHFPRAAEVVEEVQEEEEDYGVSTGRHAMHKDTDSDTASLKGTIREEDSKPGAGRGSLLSRVPTLPTLYRNILKCSLAYFLGSLFTYYTPLSRLIVELTQDGPGEKYPSAAGHMVATVYVFCAGLSPCLKLPAL